MKPWESIPGKGMWVARICFLWLPPLRVRWQRALKQPRQRPSAHAMASGRERCLAAGIDDGNFLSA